jgi:hypothetical protein
MTRTQFGAQGGLVTAEPSVHGGFRAIGGQLEAKQGYQESGSCRFSLQGSQLGVLAVRAERLRGREGWEDVITSSSRADGKQRAGGDVVRYE